MGLRNEQRIAISFGVIARGIDPRGKPFEISTETHDISCTGACLLGLSDVVEPGSKIEIQRQDQKAFYRVQWAWKHGVDDGRIGVRCLEPGKYIWGVPPKAWEPDTYDPSKPEPPIPEPVEVPPVQVGPAEWSGPDRREFPRYPCRIEAQVTIDDGSIRFPGTVTDVSLGGCYVEMLAPLPIDTIVGLVLKPGQSTMQVSGKVSSSQMGLGMGISFTQIKPADFEILHVLTTPEETSEAAVAPSDVQVTNQSPVQAPDRKITPATNSPSNAGAEPDTADLPATAEAFRAVVKLLFRKGLLTRSELIEELRRPKVTRS